VEDGRGHKALRRTETKKDMAAATARRLVLATAGCPDHGRLGYTGLVNTALFRVVGGGALAGEAVARVAAGGAFTAATTARGAVVTFGSNARGQLGHSAGAASVADPREALIPEDVVAVAAGDEHALALGASGGVWAWGRNSHGQLGLGWGAVGPDQPSPRLVPALAGEWGTPGGGGGPAPPRVVALAAGAAHSLALAEDGSVFSWGWSAGGALGHGGGHGGGGGGPAGGGGGGVEPAPRRVRALDGFGALAAIAAGGRRSAAVTAGEGRVVAWGEEGGGQGGSGQTATPSLLPLPLHAVSSLALGRAHALAARGPVAPALAWGDGGDGGGAALGVARDAAPGGRSPGPSPVLAAPDGGLGARGGGAESAVPLYLSAAAAGWKHSLGVTPDGGLVAWGWGGAPGGAFPLTPGIPTGGGQLGLGDDNDRPLGAVVADILGADGRVLPSVWRAVAVAAGVNHSVVLLEVE
jgi:alpha-tubulin suppressor-like RCC1 family protein